MIALALAALLIPMSCGELLAQQAPPPQFGRAQQDYSGQIQSDEDGYPAPPYNAVGSYPQQPSATEVQPLGTDRLEQLVAPIALYPDTLVALVLAASTYPAQVQDADGWRQAQGNAPAEQIAAAADAQNWDPSVKALTAFPQVLAQMDQNLPWATDLGTAYYNQPNDVLQAVQVMRQRAQAAGSLQPTVYEAVNYVGGNIALAPVNPQLVYVPAYNPWTVYGQPVSPYPGFSFTAALGSFASNALQFGVGIATNAFTRMPWGLLAWGVSWLVQAILFHNSNYYSQNAGVADWGFPYGGPRAAFAFGTGGAAPPGSTTDMARLTRTDSFIGHPRAIATEPTATTQRACKRTLIDQVAPSHSSIGPAMPMATPELDTVRLARRDMCTGRRAAIRDTVPSQAPAGVIRASAMAMSGDSRMRRPLRLVHRTLIARSQARLSARVLGSARSRNLRTGVLAATRRWLAPAAFIPSEARIAPKVSAAAMLPR